MKPTLRPHQAKALKELGNGKILAGGVGSGKTFVACAYYVEKESPRPVYVITTAMKRNSLDWEEAFVRYGIGKAEDATTHGVLTVDSWNNIGRYEDVTGAFFILDESRIVGSGAWVKAFLKIARNNHWILLSATPGDVWTDYIPVFIANGYYRNRTEFLRKHAVFSRFSKYPKIERFVETAKLEKYRRALLVSMPFERHTKRHIRTEIVDFDREKFNLVYKDRWNPWTNAPIEDAGELFRCMRRVVNEDPSRLGATLKWMETYPKLIVFYNFNYELDMLRSMNNLFDFPITERNGKRHDEISDNDRWVHLVQYSAGAEAWNCIDTNGMLFYSLTYSYKQFEQAQGRIDRLNTPYIDLNYGVLRSNSLIDGAIWKAIVQKKTFNEKGFLKDFG